MLQHRNSGQASWPSPGGQPSSDAAQVHEYKRQPWEQLSHAKKLPVLDQGSGLPPACPAVDQLKSEPALFARAQAKAQSQPHMQRPEGLCRSSDAPAMDQQTRTSNSGARPPVPRPGSDSGQDKPCWSLRCTRALGLPALAQAVADLREALVTNREEAKRRPGSQTGSAAASCGPSPTTAAGLDGRASSQQGSGLIGAAREESVDICLHARSSASAGQLADARSSRLTAATAKDQPAPQLQDSAEALQRHSCARDGLRSRMPAQHPCMSEMAPAGAPAVQALRRPDRLMSDPPGFEAVAALLRQGMGGDGAVVVQAHRTSAPVLAANQRAKQVEAGQQQPPQRSSRLMANADCGPALKAVGSAQHLASLAGTQASSVLSSSHTTTAAAALAPGPQGSAVLGPSPSARNISGNGSAAACGLPGATGATTMCPSLHKEVVPGVIGVGKIDRMMWRCMASVVQHLNVLSGGSNGVPKNGSSTPPPYFLLPTADRIIELAARVQFDAHNANHRLGAGGNGEVHLGTLLPPPGTKPSSPEAKGMSIAVKVHFLSADNLQHISRELALSYALAECAPRNSAGQPVIMPALCHSVSRLTPTAISTRHPLRKDCSPLRAHDKTAAAAAEAAEAQGEVKLVPGRYTYAVTVAMPRMATDARQLMRRYGPMSPIQIACIMLQICEALAFMHENGVAHGDIKPDNVLLKGSSPQGTTLHACLSDLGSAYALPVGQEWVRLQHHVCTEPYRSPEASTDGGMIYGYAADMWGVGLVITELAAGRPCYHRRATDDMVVYPGDVHTGDSGGVPTLNPPGGCGCFGPSSASAHRTSVSGAGRRGGAGKPRTLSRYYLREDLIPPNMSPALKRLAEQCLNQDPRRRPSARELSRALGEMVARGRVD